MSNEWVITLIAALITAIIGPIIVDNFKKKPSPYRNVDVHIIDKEISKEGRVKGKAKILRVTSDHNINEANKKGMRINVTFSVANVKDHQCQIAVYFRDSNGNELPDINFEYGSFTGKVSVGRNYRPDVELAIIKDYAIFMPYNEFHVSDGEHKLNFQVVLYDLTSDISLATSQKYQFVLKSSSDSSASIPEPKGSVEIVSVEYGIKILEKLHMKIHVKCSIDNMLGIPCTAAAYFYYENGEILKDTNNLYTSVNGQVSAPINFTPPYEKAIYSDLIILMPNDELHTLSGNKTGLKFFVSIYANPTRTQIASSSYQHLVVI